MSVDSGSPNTKIFRVGSAALIRMSRSSENLSTLIELISLYRNGSLARSIFLSGGSPPSLLTSEFRFAARKARHRRSQRIDLGMEEFSHED